MLSSGRMEEFVTEEEEPWYDQQDLEQGKTRHRPPSPQHPLSQRLAPAPVSVSWLPLNKGSLSCNETADACF